MTTILDEIIAHKKKELEETKKAFPLDTMIGELEHATHSPRDFRDALTAHNTIRLIAEIKKASPSKGVLRKDLDVATCASWYAEAGAAALSVLTEKKYFLGNIAYLPTARNATSLPILRKDFIVDPYQIFEAKRWGADAVLLIAAALDEHTLADFLQIAARLQLACLVEVHTQPELDFALAAGADIIGINNRSLHDFSVNLVTTEQLNAKIPDEKIVVSESGIASRADVVRLEQMGIDAVLVGETLVTSEDPREKIRELLGR